MFTVRRNLKNLMTCRAYENVAWEVNWKDIFENNVENQIIVAKEVKRRPEKEENR